MQLLEPTEQQIAIGIAAAEKESRAWKIEQKVDGGPWVVSDVLRMMVAGGINQPLTVREFADVEAARMLVKRHVWRAGIKAAINA